MRLTERFDLCLVLGLKKKLKKIFWSVSFMSVRPSLKCPCSPACAVRTLSPSPGLPPFRGGAKINMAWDGCKLICADLPCQAVLCCRTPAPPDTCEEKRNLQRPPELPAGGFPWQLLLVLNWCKTFTGPLLSELDRGVASRREGTQMLMSASFQLGSRRTPPAAAASPPQPHSPTGWKWCDCRGSLMRRYSQVKAALHQR